MQRRQFLKNSVQLGGASMIAVSATPSLLCADASGEAAASESGGERGAEGVIRAVGFGGKRASGSEDANSSVFTEIDLATGNVRQAPLHMGAAHSVIAGASGQFLCLPLDGDAAVVLDASLAERGRIVAPSGYLYSGHGILSADRRFAYVSLRRKQAMTFADTGRLGLINLSSGMLVGLFDSGGVRPHDLSYVSDGRQIAISHYGDISYEHAGQTSHNARQPRVTIFDPRFGRIVRVVDSVVDGSLTHIASDGRATVCGVPLNYVGLDGAGKKEVEQMLGGAFEISIAEELEGRIAKPMPLVLFDLATGKVESVGDDLKKQRRAQSVCYHAGSGKFFATYSFSDELAIIEKGRVTYLSAFAMGLSYIRGVTPIEGSHLIAVSGEFRGIALVDARSLKIVRRIDAALFDSPHISHALV